MAFDENLVGRIRRRLGRTGTEEKRMFGGVAFLPEGTRRGPSGKIRSSLGPAQAEVTLREPPITPFVNGNRAMKGRGVIDRQAVEGDDAMADRIDRVTMFVEALPAK